ncbi:Agamous-like MADS-box protein AGL62 [Euphorbia peplus]|nr:Agamous-like MADS-box protein AGL62 [Euphorbia peplus]
MSGENRKKTKERQMCLEMKKIEKVEARLVTFSKRRSGIYKKASELVALTGTQIAFMVYSPSGKPFVFAHPSLEPLANHFLDRPGEPVDKTHPMVEVHRVIRMEKMTKQYNDLLQQVEVEEDKESDLKQKMKGVEKGWWDTPIKEQSLQQLGETEAKLKHIHKELIKNIQERTSGGFCGSSSYVQPQTQTHAHVEVHNAYSPFFQDQVQAEVQPQLLSCFDQSSLCVFNPISFDSNDVVEMTTRGFQDQVQTKVDVQPQSFVEQSPSTMFNPFDFDPDLAPKY